MIFDILTEPWMGVIDKKTGNEKKVGLRDYIVNAHLYKRSAENKDFSILRRLQQRLAEAVIIDIYGRHIKDGDDAFINLYESGKFDTKKIDDYFETCVNSGISFDLFDEERPFMQVDKETAKKIFKPSNKASVAAINPRMSSGINKVFFQNISPDDYFRNTGVEDDRTSYYDDAFKEEADGAYGYEVKFEDYINLLLLRHCVAGYGGSGYKCGMPCVGKPPIMYQMDEQDKEKQSLFSSILLNIRYDESENGDDGLPLWRWPSYTYAVDSIIQQAKGNDAILNPKALQVSLLTGMFFPVMYLRPDYESIDVEKRTIKKIYKAGMSFSKPGAKDDLLDQVRQNWLIETEPSVATLIQNRKDKGPRTIGLSFESYNKAWLDIKIYANITEGNAPKVLKHSLYEKIREKYKEKLYADIEDADLLDDESDLSIEMAAYYLSMNQGSYLSQGKYPCCLPGYVLSDRTKYLAIKNFIDMVGLGEYSFSDDEKLKMAIGKWLQKRIRDINSAIMSVNGKPNKKGETTLVITETTLMNRYWRFCENLFKSKFIKEIENLNQSEYDDKKAYLTEIRNRLESYRKEVYLYARKLLDDIPIPKGKSILVKKELYKKKKESKK